MAGLLAQWFAPRIAALEAEKLGLLNELERSNLRVTELETWVRSETELNRTREDLLVNAALRAAGADGVPSREALQSSSEEPKGPESKPAGPTDDEILEDRAKDYAEQVYGEGYTTEQYQTVLAGMKANPTYWTTN